MSVTIRAGAGGTVTERQWVRRGELLEAARRVFESDGYHSATVSAIVQAAGLSQGAFYLYFDDKKAVFAALQEELATLLRRRIYWATRDQSDPRARVEAGLTAYFEFYSDFSEWMRRLLTEGLGIDSSFEARHTALNRTLVAAFAPTLSDLGVEDPVVAGFALIGMAQQLAYAQRSDPSGLPETAESLARACARLFCNGAVSQSKGERDA